jgi:hypothetical protein
MVLFKVQPKRDPIAPLKRQAPWAIDMDRIASWLAAQSMKVKTGLMQRVQTRRRFKRIKPNHRTLSQVGSNPSLLSRLEQFFQTAVPEASDHNLSKLVPPGS